MNEFDRFVRSQLKPLGYVRYGDDFVLFVKDRARAGEVQKISSNWLKHELRLPVHARNTVIKQVRQGLHFLGHHIYPGQPPVIDKAMSVKIKTVINHTNVSSYSAMNLPEKLARQLPWFLLD